MSNVVPFPVRVRSEPQPYVRFQAGTGVVFVLVLVDGIERELAFVPEDATELAEACLAAVRVAEDLERRARGEST